MWKTKFSSHKQYLFGLLFSIKAKKAHTTNPQTTLQKHLGMFLDSKLNFNEDLKTIGLLRKLQTLLPRAPLITIYKLFIRPHLDCADMIYNQTFNKSFQQKIGAIRGSSRENL